MIARPRTSFARSLLGAAVVAALVALVPATGDVRADETLRLTTPFPTIETQPGSDVTLDLSVSSAVPEVVDLRLDGLPDGWEATMRGGGFVVHSITSDPEGAAIDLEIAVPADAPAGDHTFSVVATDAAGGRSVVDVTLMVAEQVNTGVRLTTDFPKLTGEPGGSFQFDLTVNNDTPIEQTFTFDPSGPHGWTVTASPTAESRAQTVTVEAGATAGVQVSATAPQSVEQGSYPIDVEVIGANGASGRLTLEAEVVGTPVLTLGTADDRLNTSGPANTEKRIPLIVANTGSAPLEAVKLAGTAPSGWDVSFDPQEIESVQPGETAQVTAIVQPSADAVAGDYALTIRSSAGSLSSNVELRYTLEGSRTLGIVAIGVIVAAFAALGVVFVKFGRR